MENQTAHQRRITGPTPRNTAVFIDMENLFGGYAGSVDGVPVAKIIADVRQVGAQLGVVSDIAIMRAYANWSDPRLGVYRREMMEVGIEPIQVFGFGQQVKDAADIELVVDALATVYESSFIEVVVIVSGDGGFVPLVRHLHALGRYVILVSTSPSRPPNKLLRAVVDHHHIVGEDRSVDGTPLQRSNSSLTAEAARALIRAAVDAEPDLVKDGVINSALLGNRVRARDAGFALQGTGYKSFTALAVDALGHEQPPVAIGVPTTRVELRSTIHTIVATDEFAAWFDGAAVDGAMPAQRLLAALGVGCPDLPSCLKKLFPAAKLALRYALAGTRYGLAVDDHAPPGLLVVPNERATLDALDETDLASERVIRDALWRCTPPLRIPDTVLFGDVLDAVLGSTSRPTTFSGIVEQYAGMLEEWPADMVRMSLVALVALGVLVHTESPETLPFEDRELALADDVSDIDAALDLLRRGVDARLQPYAWPSTSALVDTIAVEHTANAAVARG